jgi:hypothetical protein
MLNINAQNKVTQSNLSLYHVIFILCIKNRTERIRKKIRETTEYVSRNIKEQIQPVHLATNQNDDFVGATSTHNNM